MRVTSVECVGKNSLVLLATVMLAWGLSSPALAQIADGDAPFSYWIGPNTPLDDIMPAGPLDAASLLPVLTDDLAEVPELAYQEPLDKKLTLTAARKQIALTLSKISFLDKKNDGFILMLKQRRPDLQGLPFLMGADCKLTEPRLVEFEAALGAVRTTMVKSVQKTGMKLPLHQTPPNVAAVFWMDFQHAEQARKGPQEKQGRARSGLPSRGCGTHAGLRAGLPRCP